MLQNCNVNSVSLVLFNNKATQQCYHEKRQVCYETQKQVFSNQSFPLTF